MKYRTTDMDAYPRRVQFNCFNVMSGLCAGDSV